MNELKFVKNLYYNHYPKNCIDRTNEDIKNRKEFKEIQSEILKNW